MLGKTFLIETIIIRVKRTYATLALLIKLFKKQFHLMMCRAKLPNCTLYRILYVFQYNWSAPTLHVCLIYKIPVVTRHVFCIRVSSHFRMLVWSSNALILSTEYEYLKLLFAFTTCKILQRCDGRWTFLSSSKLLGEISDNQLKLTCKKHAKL